MSILWSDIKKLKITAPERKLIEASKRGIHCILGKDTPTGPDQSREIRAEILKYLILGGCDKCRVHELGVSVSGAIILGSLNISYCIAPRPTQLINCLITRRLEMNQVTLHGLSLAGSAMPGLSAANIRVDGNFVLGFGFVSTEDTDLSYAKINGQLICNGGHFLETTPHAILAQGIEVSGDIFMSEDFFAAGEVNISGSTINGQLSCRSSCIMNENGDCIVADRILIKGGAYLSDSKFHGELSFSGAVIEGQLALTSSRVINPTGYTLNLHSAVVHGTTLLNKGFQSDGELSISGATFHDKVTFSTATLRNERRACLSAENVKIHGSLQMDAKFSSEGLVTLNNSMIDGNINCRRSRFSNASGISIISQSSHISKNVLLDIDFESNGDVDLTGSTIEGSLSCIGAKFTPKTRRALIAQRLQVKGTFAWRRVKASLGAIDLRSARIGELSDDLDSWKGCGRVRIGGFTYQRLSNSFMDTKSRLEWLHQCSKYDSVFLPQPYEQLAIVLRSEGHTRAARDVLIEQNRLLRANIRARSRVEPNGDVSVAFSSVRSDLINLGRYVWDHLQRWLIGYGHKPARSLWVLAALLTMSIFIGDMAWRTGAMVPNSDVILTSDDWKGFATRENAALLWSAKKAPGADWETFNRYAWGFDVVVPLVELGQVEAWVPSSLRGFWGWNAWWMRWVLTVLGWLVAALGLAAFTGVIRRD